MKTLCAIVLLLFSQFSWGFNYDVIKGQWAVYGDSKYYFLNINNDYSGTMVYDLGNGPAVLNFKTNDVIKRNGYLEINLTPTEKAVLSAWKLKSGSGRLTGQIFMYKENGELFNMLYFPLQLLTKNHKFLNHEPIKRLSAKYR